MKLRIGGVPEHFNYPWYFAIENSTFNRFGLEVEWVDVKGGSGAMTKMLEEGELDLALVLTEGIIKHITKGGKARIIQQFVKSPLIWGVHSSLSFDQSKGFENARFARSRAGSGSHIMAYVHAEQRGYIITEDNFITVGNIEGAIEAFKNNEADILLWEKFMTQPYVQSKKAKRVDECISPWPCFVLVGSEQFLNTNPKAILSLSDALILACETVMKRTDTVGNIAKRYNLKTEKVEQWYSTVEWQTSDWISAKMLQNVVNTLHRVGAIEAKLEPDSLCYNNVKLY